MRMDSPAEDNPQHDLDILLGMVLSNLESAEQDACACALHRTRPSSRSTAIATRKHLSLARYHRGRVKARYLVHSMDPDSVPAAAARAAAAPLLPWQMLADVAAAGALTSLDISAPQAQHLVDEDPAAAGPEPEAAPAAVAPAAVAPAAPPAAAAVPGLAIALAGLRCLHVADIANEPPQLQQVGRLVGACSGLTQLVLEAAARAEEVDTTPLIEGLGAAAAAAGGGGGEVAGAAAATAAAAAGLGQASAVDDLAPPVTAAAAPGQSASRQLQHLQALQLAGPFKGPLLSWVGSNAGPQLTALQLSRATFVGSGVLSLAACSGLRQLEMRRCQLGHPADSGVSAAEALDELTQLRALTKLVVSNCKVDGPVPPGVWALTQLRHLDFSSSWEQQQLPEDISCLKQLTYLGLSGTGLQELPSELGNWLPQLVEVVISGTKVAGIPHSLTRLTSLNASCCRISSMTAVEHLVGLKQLQLYGTSLSPPFVALSKLTALEALSLSIQEGDAVVTPQPLPRLKSLNLYAMCPVRSAAQIVGAGLHLTSLFLYDAGKRETHDIHVEQLGVLPKLCSLDLSGHRLAATALVSPWLQQQVHLTSLSVEWWDVQEVPSAWCLPPNLEELHLAGTVVELGPPDVSAQLCSLRVLVLVNPLGDDCELPAWVSSLRRLEQLSAPSDWDGWGVAAQIPLLRQCVGLGSDALSAAPHLCWAQE